MIDSSEIFSSVPYSEVASSSEWTTPVLLSEGKYNVLYQSSRYGKRFILKGLRPEWCDSTVHKEMLRKEFRIATEIDHPYIVHTLDWVHVDDIGDCIQMEYVAGRSLADFLQENPTVSARKRVLNQLLDAVSYLHQQQIVHRDIKPSNILITHNGNNVRLIDFGISDTDNYLLMKIPAGTAGFAAPEQKTEEVVDCRADIYAVGCIIRTLFPSRYRLVARKCMAVEPDERYGSCEAVLKAVSHADRRRLATPLLAIILMLILGLAYALYEQKNLRSQVDSYQEKMADYQLQADEYQEQMADYQEQLSSYQKKDSVLTEAGRQVDRIFDQYVAVPYKRRKFVYMEDFTEAIMHASGMVQAYCDSIEDKGLAMQARSIANDRWVYRYNAFVTETNYFTYPHRPTE